MSFEAFIMVERFIQQEHNQSSPRQHQISSWNTSSYADSAATQTCHWLAGVAGNRKEVPSPVTRHIYHRQSCVNYFTYSYQAHLPQIVLRKLFRLVTRRIYHRQSCVNYFTYSYQAHLPQIVLRKLFRLVTRRIYHRQSCVNYFTYSYQAHLPQIVLRKLFRLVTRRIYHRQSCVNYFAQLLGTSTIDSPA